MELTSYHELEEFRKNQKEAPHVLPTFQNPPRWNPSWLTNVYATRKDPKSEWQARDNPETSSITIKPKNLSHVAEQSCCFPYSPALDPGSPSQVSCFVNTCVSSSNSLLSVRQEPTLRTKRESLFLQHSDNTYKTSYSFIFF